MTVPPPLPSLEIVNDCISVSEGLSQFEVDISMCLFQYIQQNIRSDCSNIDKILEPPEGQDEGVWKYEHLRFVNNFLLFILLTL